MAQNTSHAVMAQRHEPLSALDDYPSPPWSVRALCEHVLPTKALKSLTCWEPACNRGYMAKPLAEYFAEVITSDIHNYGWNGHQLVRDFLIPHTDDPKVDCVITNPPFKLAAQFALRALSISDMVAMLVRTSFLEGQERHETLFKPYPPSIVAQFVERVPMVRGRHDPDASTATSYAWIIWKRGWTKGTSFQWIPPCRRQLQKATDV